MSLIFTTRLPSETVGDPRTYSDPNGSSGPVCLNAELGAIIDTTHAEHGEKYNHDIVVKKIGSGLNRYDSDHRMKEPLLYPLLFPYGTPGYGFNVYFHQRESTRKDGTTYHRRITPNEYLKYLLYRRNNNQDVHLRHGRLTQEWILCSYLQTEKQKLNYLRNNQKKLKADKYKEVIAAKRANALGVAGKHIILPSSHRGSPRDNVQRYCDAMAVVREHGKPSYFITMTCNAKWKEIVDSLPPGMAAHQCPDLVSRVFSMKLKSLMHDLTTKHVLGREIAHTYVVEFQKRGLPHAHILLIMKEEDRPKAADQYDAAVSAEFSDNPVIRKVQSEFMIHRCTDYCRDDKNTKNCCCKKGYPKPFCQHTVDSDNSYPNYRRRSPDDGGQTVVIKNKTTQKTTTFDNRRVVPHNIFLLMKYRCHLNVEVCNSIACVKYLYKYVYKGHDRVMYGVKAKDQLDLPPQQCVQNGPAQDEIKKFVDSRYCTTSEACWHSFGFTMGELSPRVERLSVHLNEEQNTLFTADEHEVEESLKASEVTKLTAFFTICQEEKLMYGDGPIPERVLKGYKGPPAREILYRDVAKWYSWQKRDRDKDLNAHWKRRKNPSLKVVGRIRHVAPTMECKELFHVRLLLNTKPGPTSFEDLRTVNGVIHDTYHAAAFAMGLVEDDREWYVALEESANVGCLSSY